MYLRSLIYKASVWTNAEECVCKTVSAIPQESYVLHKPNLCYVSLMLQECGEGGRAQTLEKKSGFQRKGILPWAPHSLCNVQMFAIV